MALEDVALLLVRPQDLVVARAQLVGFSVTGDQLTAGSAGARIVLTLPPQATGETAYDAAAGLAQARVGGPSRLTFLVAPGTSGPLTATGVLTLAADGTLDVSDAPPGLEPISVELPWRIRFALRGRSGDRLFSTFAAAPQVGGSGAAGLWHLRVEAASGVALVPLDVDADEDDGVQGIVPPLDRSWRDRIVAEGSPPQAPPFAPFVDLSALGATMTAEGAWPSFSWKQATVLGRDMAIRVEAAGSLYPWGHRAVLIEVADRELIEESGGATAGLVVKSMLVVTDPVRRRAADGPLARGLPFDEVEVLQTVVELGDDATFLTQQRQPKRLEELERLGAERQAQASEQANAVPGMIDQLRADINAGGEARIGELEGGMSFDERNLLADYERVAQERADWEAAHPFVPDPPDEPVIVDEFGTVISGGSSGTSEPVDLGPPGLNVFQFEQMRGLRARADAILTEQEQVRAATAQAVAAVMDESSLVNAGPPYSTPVTERDRLRAEADQLAATLAAAREQANQVHRVAQWATVKGGSERLHLPLRCDALRTTTPVMFLHEVEFAENDDFPAFAPLRDPSVLGQIADAWNSNPARRLPLPGTPVDLVRSGPTPQPSDVLPVQEITVSGAPDPLGGFRAVIEEAKVALKAVGELVPGVDGLTRVVYDPVFLAEGLAEEVALRLPDKIGIDFSDAADKAGGLLSPVLEADVLSRVYGPVDLRTLPGMLTGPPDLSAVFSDAKLLGIPLGRLIDTDLALPEPLAIVATPDGGATMTWTDVKLKNHGPFRVQPGKTKFTLTVKRTPAETVTTCKVEAFTLVLPPGGTDLVLLNFRSLTFTQRPGRPPDLEVDGLKVELGGDLDLLKTLESFVQLGDDVPAIRSTPTGLSASYHLEVPEVPAGMFLMKNIAVTVGVDVPFDGQPIVTTLAFASKEKPFMLSVSTFAGSGYLVFEIAEAGIRRLEAALEFGAAVAINVGIAKAEVHALGGASFLLQGDEVRVNGFLRIGGSVDVLGLVSISVELRVELSYAAGSLTGRATAVIEIDVTFWSGSIQLDSGTYTFAGPTAVDAAPPVAAVESQEPSLADWQKYRDKFGPA